MTLGAGAVVRAIASQLAVGIALVQRVTGQAGKPAALVTRRFEQSVVIPARDPDHPIGPEEVPEEIGIAGENVRQPGYRRDSRRPDDGCGLFQIIAWPETKSTLPPAFRLIEPFHGVAKTTDLR